MSSSLLRTLESFVTYIDGGSTSDLKRQMRIYDNNIPKLEKHFRTPGYAENEDVREILKRIILTLTISELEEIELFKKNTIYDFLTEISQKGEQQTAYILDLIDDRTWFDKIKAALSGGLTFTLFAASIVYILAFEELLGFVLTLQTSLLLVPILGLIFTCIASFYQFLQNQYDKTTSRDYKIRNNLFLALGTLISITGYALILFSASTFFILTSLLILGAVINVIKEIFDLVRAYQIHKPDDDLLRSNDILIHRACIRSEANYAKRRNDMLISLVASLLIMVIVITWCFLPAGIYITAAIMALKGIVYLTKMLMQKLNELYEREKLQTELYNDKNSLGEMTQGEDPNPDVISTTPYKETPNRRSTRRFKNGLGIVFDETPVDTQEKNSPTAPLILRNDVYRGFPGSPLHGSSVSQKLDFSDDVSKGCSSAPPSPGQ